MMERLGVKEPHIYETKKAPFEKYTKFGKEK